MNRVKILSPAGDYESLRQAVYAGADEVYLGIKDYNARNIEGFDIDSLRRAVNFAHGYGVSVYLAINILFRDCEIQSALDLVIDAYNLGIDAFIVQDIGLATLIRRHYPEITLHASTQMAVHNLEGVRVLERIGYTRVVLSRETPLSEIRRIHEASDIEIEYFVQGALCVSFSGNCYMSSYLEGASGNRGKCKQLCRLPITLSYEDKEIKTGYLLSAKDFCMDKYLDELISTGVTSLKIEGRARRPYYVATATRYYRNLLDGKTADKVTLSLAFNRGYTAGYFDGNGDIISNVQGHNGIQIGKVSHVDIGKRFNVVEISTTYPLSPRSTLKILREGVEVMTLAPYDIKPNDIGVVITTTAQLSINDAVYLLADARLEDAIRDNAHKHPIDIHITARAGHPIVAVLTRGTDSVTVTGDVVDRAKNSPLSMDDFVVSYNKHEYYSPNITVDIDDIFMTKSKLNEFRRKCYAQLDHLHTRSLEKIKISTSYAPQVLTDFCLTETGEIGEARVQIYSPSEYDIDKIKQFVTECTKAGRLAYLDLPNVAFARDIDLIRKIIAETNIGIVANNLYALDLSPNIIAGSGLNIYNNYTAEFFSSPCLIAEDSDLVSNYNMPYMTMLHCPIKSHVGGDCTNCRYRDGYSYTMPSGKTMRLKRKKLSTCVFYLTD